MNSKIVIGLLSAGFLVATSSSVMASSMRDCIIEKGAMELTDGQMMLLRAHGDMKINILSTVQDQGLDVPDGVAVHHLMWRAGIDCALGK